ncbi:MAG: TerB family tellurite resistance protein [SAR324 cluster bacterium]|nr:TerB family tellurite resistance protein [SAR324 cluster bacterium]
MSTLTQEDLKIIVSAAVGMATQDHKLKGQERDFLEKLMQKTGVKPEEVEKNADYKALAKKLSSKKAKQVFMLTIAAVAKADNELDPSEKHFIMSMAKELDVGIIDVERHSHTILEKMALDHLSD